MDEHGHQPVIAKEVMELLGPRPGEVAVDCTVGRGGHTMLLADAVGAAGHVVGFDLDAESLEYAGERIEAAGAQLTPINESFLSLPRQMEELGLRADIILADLGFNSVQMDDPSRGFSFRTDGPLDMRYDLSHGATAADLLASMTERELANVIWEYGEEPLSRKIARKLVQMRENKPIQTTTELAELVVQAYGPRARHSRMHPATRTFMALRIAVNDELGMLSAFLDLIARGAEHTDEGGWMRAGARVGIISFHSLEDRLVKRAFVDLAKSGRAKRLTKRPIAAGAQEVQANSRSRSAKLRVVRMDVPVGE